jgi:hypothetical protein
MMTPQHEAEIRAAVHNDKLLPANLEAALFMLGYAEGSCRQLLEEIDRLRAETEMNQQTDRDFLIGLMMTLRGQGSHPGTEPMSVEQQRIIADNIELQLYPAEKSA